MNILLVDDKYDVVYGIAQGVDWAGIGEIRLFFAFSGKEALDIIEKNHIQLLITDIEMPGMSGLELADILQKKKADVGVIFLSSHDSFRYAQAAIRLGCYDYILQPVEYEKLQNSIIHVLNQMLLRKKDSADGGQAQEYALRREHAWKEILLHKPAYDAGLIRDILEDAQIYLRANGLYRVVLAVLFYHRQPLNSWITKRTEKELMERLRGAFPPSARLVADFMTNGRQCVMVLEDGDLVPAMEEFLEDGAAGSESSLAIYISRPAALAQLPLVYQELNRMIADNVGQYGGVFEYREAAEGPQDELAVSDMLAVRKWKGWLLDGEQDRIREDILRFLQKKDQARKLDKRTLVVLAQLIVSTFYSFETCSAEKMLTNPQILDCLDQSTNSAAGLLAFLDKVTAQYKERVLLNEKDGNAALLGQIKSYVGSHLENPLNREEIAEKFFISKDYLSHLFARQEGMGFTQYVNEQRISKAKELLQNSDLPIKIIALNVGISDYAYFSKMFRKSAGISANEYRILNRDDK
ncbi:MAG: response regulator [Lachnospiraceae bacterium]|nr:response regulator [Lachnospiraceae bacterium]